MVEVERFLKIMALTLIVLILPTSCDALQDIRGNISTIASKDCRS